MSSKWVNAIVLVVLLLGMVACKPTPKSVKIVAALPLDTAGGSGLGLAATITESMNLALEEANGRAGDLEVTFEVWNTANANGIPDPALEQQMAEKAAADPTIVLYIGSLGSAGSKITIPILNAAGIPQISPSATYPGLTKAGFAAGEPGIYYPTGQRTFFRVCTTDDMAGPAGALWIKDQALTSVYIVQQNDSYGQGAANSFLQTARGAGLTIVGTAEVAADQQTGLEQIVSDIATLMPDIVYIAAYGDPSMALTEQLYEKGVTTQILGTTLYRPGVIERLGAAAEGIMATESSIPNEQLSPQAQDFIKRFQARYGHDLGTRVFWGILSYDAMRMALNVIGQGKADRAAVLDGLRKIEFEGLVGRWSFDENGDTRLLVVSGYVVKDGQWETVGLLRVR